MRPSGLWHRALVPAGGAGRGRARQARQLARQAGFALVELMVAGVVAVGLLATLMLLVLQAADLAGLLHSRAILNAEARLVWRLLADGGLARDGAVLVPVNGLRARAEGGTATRAPPAGADLVVSHVLRLTEGDEPPALDEELLSSVTPAVLLPCLDVDDPVEGCVLGGNVPVSGRIGSTPLVDAPTGGLRWRGVTLDLIDADAWLRARVPRAMTTQRWFGRFELNVTE